MAKPPVIEEPPPTVSVPWLSNWSIETVSLESARVLALVKTAPASPVIVTVPARSSARVFASRVKLVATLRAALLLKLSVPAPVRLVAVSTRRVPRVTVKVSPASTWIVPRVVSSVLLVLSIVVSVEITRLP